MGRVVIGMDPHKRSATIEVLDDRERVLQVGRFGTDRYGYKQLLTAGRCWPERVWAVEGCNGVGRHIAQRLVADGEPVVDVPAKLSARARVFATGQGRKTDATDAHSVAVVALRIPGLRPVQVDDTTVALRLLVDRRDELGAARTWTVNRLHRLLLELVPGGAKKFLSATQTKTLLATVRPRDVVGKTRRKLAAELIVELDGIDRRIKAANKELRELVEATGSTLLELNGIGPFRTATGSPEPGTGGSTGCCASWRSCSCATTPKAAPITGARSALARRRWKPCEPSNDGCPTSSTRRLVANQKRLRQAGTRDGPGRTRGGGYWLQCGRVEPQRRRLGEVTSRTRQTRGYARRGGPPKPFSGRFPPPCPGVDPQPRSSAVRLTPARTGAPSTGGNDHPLTQRGPMRGIQRQGWSREHLIADLTPMGAWSAQS